MIRLKGMTWKHERGIAPLLAATAAFGEQRPDVTIEWEARSLHDFEQYPLELLAGAYDLIMIDHPHLGEAADRGLLVPLDGLLPEAYLREQERGSVGLSYASYAWAGRQWALAADAAAQVGAYREDLLSEAGLQPPKTWADVTRLAAELPEGRRIAMPLVPVHAFASFYTLCSQLGGGAFWQDGAALPLETGEGALALLQELMPLLHPDSASSDPIAMSERMARTDDIAYVPLIYGYVNYARDGFAPHPIRFADIPASGDAPSGSMIGGVGLAISSRCRYPELAAAFAEMTVSPEFQRTTYFHSGGQPGHRSAWLDAEVNRQSRGFFVNTLRTLDHGAMRPRFNGFVAFQERAGVLIREFLLRGSGSRKELVERLNAMALASYRARG